MPLPQLAPSSPFPPGQPDVQRTSFSLDVVGRFLCSTWVEATTNPDFDAVVIGAGMYGGYYAAKLYTESAFAGRPMRVLVLEAGPYLVPEHVQNLPDLGLGNPFRPVLDTFSPAAQQPRDLVWGMGWRGNVGFPGTAYCVGGKSLYWGGWCPRLTAADLAQWPAEVRDYLTQPPSFGSSLPNRPQPANPPASVYEAVEFEIGVKPPDDYVFDPVAGPNDPPGSVGLNAALGARLKAALTDLRGDGTGTPLADPAPPPIAVQTQSFVSGVFAPDKFSSLPLLFSVIRNAAGAPDDQRRLFLVPQAHVVRLETEAARVTAIQLVVNGEAQRLPIKPGCVVALAAGCIESTRLALESVPTAPGDPAKERIGRNLMAHLRFDFPFSLSRKDFADWVKANTGQTLRAELQTASFHLQGDTPHGRFHLQAYAAGIENSPEGLLYRMIPDTTVAARLAAQQDPNQIAVIFRACGEMRADRTRPVHAPGTNWIDLASPADRDTVFNHARAFVHYEDQGAQPIWGAMEAACRRLATAMGGRGLQPVDRHEVGSTWHDAGTLHMGDDPAQAVTDTTGRFHHVANLACVDQGLFPTVGSANPVLTGLCLARRAAEAIVLRRVTAPAPALEPGFTDLMANAALWKANDPALTAARSPFIENGSIIEANGALGNGVLFLDDPALFADLELRLQWKAFGEEANSGIFLRAPRPGATLDDAGFFDRAIEVQIDDTGWDGQRYGNPLHRTGAVYKRLPARGWPQKAPSRDGEEGAWNDCRITLRGQRIRVELNGRLASAGDVPITAPGLLALQFHTGKVQFRALRVKRL